MRFEKKLIYGVGINDWEAIMTKHDSINQERCDGE